MANTWLTADTHWGHANIIRYCTRPFKDVDEMNDMLIKNWNSVVGYDDDVYHLGDFSFMPPKKTVGVLHSLRGRIHLVRGNHDAKSIAGLEDKFVWVKDMAEVTIEGQRIIMCHYPLMTWNKSHHGSWSLHGHCHGTLPDDPRARRLDVGVDVHGYVPIPFSRVKELMSKKKFEPIDHHGRSDRKDG